MCRSRPKSYAVPEPRPDSGVERITSPIRDLELNSRSDRASKGRHTPDFFIPVSRLSGRTSGSEATRSDRSDSPALRGILYIYHYFLHLFITSIDIHNMFLYFDTFPVLQWCRKSAVFVWFSGMYLLALLPAPLKNWFITS